MRHIIIVSTPPPSPTSVCDTLVGCVRTAVPSHVTSSVGATHQITALHPQWDFYYT